MFFYYHYCWCCHCSHCYRCDHCHYHRNRHHHHHHQESTEGIAPPPWPAPLARPWPSPWFFGFRVDRVPGCHLAWNAPLVPFLNFPASSHGRAILWEPLFPVAPRSGARGPGLGPQPRCYAVQSCDAFLVFLSFSFPFSHLFFVGLHFFLHFGWFITFEFQGSLERSRSAVLKMNSYYTLYTISLLRSNIFPSLLLYFSVPL